MDKSAIIKDKRSKIEPVVAEKSESEVDYEFSNSYPLIGLFFFLGYCSNFRN